ncbi:Diphthamide biosynthesis protein [Phaffia rhodozyma]|uniref:2-(3-amino-3-carboxypropyl)histidine synthase subunit 1 n=1 Tax=Phaffia rhodozyma TaxID=264483 RepID=A0A0F7SN66_PHARH|nr:Diphthamide biosynthesis protein [Phaffia rhodozyma]
MSEPVSSVKTPTSSASKPKKRFVGTSSTSSRTRAGGPSKARVPLNQIPDEILNDPEINRAIGALPSNYNFEIHKTIHQMRRDNVQAVALQMPEGLMIYGCLIGDILERFTSAHPILLADVTYGACCIDDFTARSLGADMIVHYGHSCLIPTTQTTLKTLYVFVEISIDAHHLVSTVRTAFPSSKNAFGQAVLHVDRRAAGHAVNQEVNEQLRAEAAEKVAAAGEGRKRIMVGVEPEPVEDFPNPTTEEEKKNKTNEKDGDDEELPTKLALVSTIQFVASVQVLRNQLEESLPPLSSQPTRSEPTVEGDAQALAVLEKENEKDEEEKGLWRGKYEIVVPQARPLSPGEILGCTAPKLASDVDALLYVGDGRFHLESIMIANPTVPAFRYDPYSKKFTRELYDHESMRESRSQAVNVARKSLVVDTTEKGKGQGSWAVVLGTLGRQGSVSVIDSITSSLAETKTDRTEPPLPLLISELSPAKVSLFPPSISIFVQTSCPRLSIDWGAAFGRPVLTPYEASLALGKVKVSAGERTAGWEGGMTDRGEGYPMDFWADDSLGPWTPRHGLGRPKRSATGAKPAVVSGVA